MRRPGGFPIFGIVTIRTKTFANDKVFPWSGLTSLFLIVFGINILELHNYYFSN